MPAIFRTSPVEVTNRLDELGWRQDQLLEVVGAMVAARNSCTSNNPSSASGWMSWKEGMRRMREIGCPRGWRGTRPIGPLGHRPGAGPQVYGQQHRRTDWYGGRASYPAEPEQEGSGDRSGGLRQPRFLLDTLDASMNSGPFLCSEARHSPELVYVQCILRGTKWGPNCRARRVAKRGTSPTSSSGSC